MEVIFEVLKYTIPALVVFLASYFILRQYLQAQYSFKSLEQKGGYAKEAIPLKLQAYERLLLFCERISIPNLLGRLQTRNMTAEALRNAMMISVQKEYEHNIAQQLYTSSRLWEIITLTKNEILGIISKEGAAVDDNENAQVLAEALYTLMGQHKKNPVDIAKKAIKEEAKIILDV